MRQNITRQARTALLTAGLLTAGLTLAQGVQSVLDLVVGGQVSSTHAIVVKGEAFVPVSALTRLGVRATRSGNTLTLTAGASTPGPVSPVGGTNQRPATEGCLGDTLFNGVWRVKVLAVKAVARDEGAGAPGWGVDLEFRNATSKDISPTISIDAFGKGIYLFQAGGNPAGDISGDGVYYTFAKDLPPGGVLRGQMRFYAGSDRTTWPAFTAARPTKLILSVLNPTPVKNEGLAYNTQTPSFRVDLTCSK
ncbi:hypothetical protein [Deinococcus hopiensis]|uniref:Copper amine oxidase N-terminal domain-containing protein n=1 Tax=Deinococcus hopiensis KR-140 TaxID=695939 RepID=A0A1W1VWQ9_9DEIO|nr:hypothetical protein [Deinococcus hopiensis]SMB97541.1 hypothetical protein SAMN00790413_06035 [Deinococcus hopiensis KR-140]